jgi:hypothetical protein
MIRSLAISFCSRCDRFDSVPSSVLSSVCTFLGEAQRKQTSGGLTTVLVHWPRVSNCPDPFERKRFCPYKLHCYLIPVLTRVRFNEALIVIPEPVTSSHFFVAEVVYAISIKNLYWYVGSQTHYFLATARHNCKTSLSFHIQCMYGIVLHVETLGAGRLYEMRSIAISYDTF